MYGDDVEVFGDVGVVECWFSVGEDLDPGDDADGDEMFLVVLSDGVVHFVDPCGSDLFACAVVEFERDALDEVFSCEFTGEPVGGGFVAGENGFVHEVVAEDGGGVVCGLGDGLPEVGLCFPAL